ncbi:hypothetical protein C8A05DRAFT_32612 [Staphylotrichum tortipilum]|uniref:Uncharacterized protein n=1 Tax=Staphylotrichum tortipilum TaxID=2831512 RepID=A0AAN6MNI2_9PEZI|nr:hypothetical protein C8A05DRAFT_32612 [Staphylotrichum longicolle]
MSQKELAAFIESLEPPAPPYRRSAEGRGQASTTPEFTWYLGVNSGPYKTTDNGTVVLPPVPIEWIIAPRNVTAGQCPTASDNLRLFGFTNFIVMFLILFVGCRPLISLLARGLLGQPSRYSPYWTWLVSFGLQAGANAIISYLIISSPGYEHLSMLNVFALYSSRPRIGLLWTAMLRIFVRPVRVPGSVAVSEKKKRPKGEKSGGRAPPPPLPQHEWIYTDSYIATSVSEFLLQLVSAVFVGVTWRRFPNQPICEHMEGRVNLMLAAPALALLGWGLVPIWHGRSRGLDERLMLDTFAARVGTAVAFMAFTSAFTYAVPWVYWAEFLKLPGSL